jgi:hypothetical protein
VIAALAFTLAVQKLLKPNYVLRLRERNVRVWGIYGCVSLGVLAIIVGVFLPNHPIKRETLLHIQSPRNSFPHFYLQSLTVLWSWRLSGQFVPLRNRSFGSSVWQEGWPFSISLLQDMLFEIARTGALEAQKRIDLTPKRPLPSPRRRPSRQCSKSRPI